MKSICVFFIGVLLSFSNSVAAQELCMSVKKIWDNGVYSAFPSIIKFNGKYYCSFREGESHIFDKDGNASGKVRILVSDDGENWRSAALISKLNYDLRDPKLSVTPQGKLMVIIGGSVYKEKKLISRDPLVCFSVDGRHYTPLQQVKLDPDVYTGNDWLWRVTWDGDTGYGVNYASQDREGGKPKVSLLKTVNGVDFDLITHFDIPNFPNEATVRIMEDKEMFIMIRREEGDRKGYWGRSYPPYTSWNWRAMDVILGGPDFMAVDSTHFVAGTRSHYIESFPKTVLLTGDKSGKFQEAMVLPSGGDTSYPGFLIVNEELWTCYYSQHESNNAAIYLAKIPLSSLFPEKR